MSDSEEFVKCSKCHREATYDSPEPLCDPHWQLWFSCCGNRKLSEVKEEVVEQLLYAWKKLGRPNDADEQLEEARNLKEYEPQP